MGIKRNVAVLHDASTHRIGDRICKIRCPCFPFCSYELTSSLLCTLYVMSMDTALVHVTCEQHLIGAPIHSINELVKKLKHVDQEGQAGPFI